MRISRLNAGKLRLEPTRFDLTEALSEQIENYRATSTHAASCLEWRFAEPVVGHPDDGDVGRRTFGVCFGVAASRRLYEWTLLGPFALTVALAVMLASPAPLLPLALLPAAWRLRRDMIACPPGPAFTALLVRTFKLELIFAVLLSAAIVIARIAG